MKNLIIAGILLAGAASLNAWTGPTGTPPLNNVAAPINVGATTQAKAGVFGSHGFYSLGKVYIMGGPSGPYDETDFANTLTALSTGWPAGTSALTLFNYGSVGADAYCDDYGLHCVAGDDLVHPPLVFSYQRYSLPADTNQIRSVSFTHPVPAVVGISVNLHSMRIPVDRGGLVRTIVEVDGETCGIDQDERDSIWYVVTDFYTSASCTLTLTGTSTVSELTVHTYAEPNDGHWNHSPIVDVTVFNP